MKSIMKKAIVLHLLSASLSSAFIATSNLYRPSSTTRTPELVMTNKIHNDMLYMSSNSNAQQKQKQKFRNRFKSLKQRASKSKLASSTSFNFVHPESSSSPKDKFMQPFFKLRNINEVTKWRIAAFTFISSIFAFSPQLDVGLVNVWHWLQNGSALLPRFFRHDHWEWGVAVVAFFFWIHGFWLADRAVAKADVKGILHPWKKYRLQDQYEKEKFRRRQLRKLENGSSSVEEHDVEQAKPPVTKQQKWNLGFWIFELPLYCLPLFIWDICIPRRAAKLATWGAPTALGVCKDVTLALLLYDLGFFVCHYLMHKIPFIHKHVHAKHHISTEVRASDIVRLSFVEEIVDVGISILALNYIGCHPLSRTFYNIIITFLLTELHCGFAFPWTPQFVVPFGLATGSKGHHFHHRFGKHYYQKFFCHVDKLFGFVQKKDGSLKGFTVS